jgi:hypothetical protein
VASDIGAGVVVFYSQGNALMKAFIVKLLAAK